MFRNSRHPGLTLVMLLFLTFTLFSAVTLPSVANAEEAQRESSGVPEPRIPLPGFEPKKSFKIKPETINVGGAEVETGRKFVDIPWLAQYIFALYKFLLTAIGLIAVTMIIIGGVFWMTAGGSSEKVKTGKEYIGGAIMGTILALLSYTLLSTINPQLIALKPLKVPVVERIATVGNMCDETTIQALGPDEQLVFKQAAWKAISTDQVSGEQTEVLSYFTFDEAMGHLLVTNPSGALRKPNNVPCGIPHYYAVKKIDGGEPKFRKEDQCFGSGLCPSGSLCTLARGTGKYSFYECQWGLFDMTVNDDGRLIDDDYEEIYAVCGTTNPLQVSYINKVGQGRRKDIGDNVWFFTAWQSNYLEDLGNACSITLNGLETRRDVLGLVMILEVKDDDSWGVDSDDWFIIGGKACAGGKAYYTNENQNPIDAKEDIKKVLFNKHDLIPVVTSPGSSGRLQYKMQSKKCNLTINKNNFSSDNTRDLQ